jgi:acyl dehydratase
MTDWYYEDLEVGFECITPARTVTEADIVTFAGLSGDFNALHTNEEFARSTIFQGRIAHGLLGLAISSGLFTRTEFMQRIQKSLMAFLSLTWKFTGPIKIGDTISTRVKLLDKKETKKPDRGIIVLERTVINQREEVVQQGETTLMIARRST